MPSMGLRIATRVSFALLLTSVFADDLEPEDLNNANFELIRGNPQCPKTFRFLREDTTYSGADIRVNDNTCTGAGTLKLIKNPTTGGTALTKKLRTVEDRDDSYEGTLTDQLVCGRYTLQKNTYFQFISPEDGFTVNPSELFGSQTHPLAGGSNKNFKFDEDRTYLIVQDQCIYRQRSRLANLDPDDGSDCFPASASVELESGAVIPMSQLRVGDSVLTGVNEYSKVFMFTHKLQDELRVFIAIRTESGAELVVSRGHYLYADGALVAASHVSVGAEVTLASGKSERVTSISTRVLPGLFAPHTVSGDIVVDGILASTYTQAVEPALAHAVLAPFRFASQIFGFAWRGLEAGGGSFAPLAPRGRTVH